MFELGNSLREGREKQGLDLSQVELATKIRAKYLHALEDEAFDVLPSETYVKGFLRSYAEYLGLDGQLYVDEYTSRYGSERSDEPYRRARVHQDRGLERKVVLVALAGIAVLTALVIAAWKFGGSSPPSTGIVPATTTTTARPQAAAPELKLRGVGSGTYVEVRRGSSTGKVLLQATVGGGTVQRISGSRFWLYVRRSRGLEVKLDGKNVSLPARKNLRVLVTPTRTALAGN
jgi:cytoskeleton protein RodZ